MRVLQIGLGGFGTNHLKAWGEMDLLDRLFLVEADASKHEAARRAGIPAERVGTSMGPFLDEVDVVDVVTGTEAHFPLCGQALEAGKHVFVEKPMTMTAREAESIAELAESAERALQVGFYYRYHPLARWTKARVAGGDLGVVRAIGGSFMGFKRARTDVGVVHTDGIHFIDLFNWFVGEPPDRVTAVVRDHFGRGMEDFGLVVLEYPGGAVARVEAGYVQPGKWRDKVVPNALTSKEFYLSGSVGTVEVDFETEQGWHHTVRHEFNGQTWAPIFGDSTSIATGTLGPIQMIVAELTDFLERAESGNPTRVGPVDAGIVPARVMEAVYRSNETGSPQTLQWSDRERAAFAVPITPGA